MKKNLPDKDYFIGKPIPDYPGYVVKDYIKPGCNGLVFLAYNANLKKSVACKIIPVSNLRKGALDTGDWFKEAQKANILDSRAVVRCQHSAIWKDEPNGIDCVVLCFDYIKGPSLKDYIGQNKKNISIKFIASSGEFGPIKWG